MFKASNSDDKARLLKLKKWKWRKPGKGEVEFCEVLLNWPDTWFHLYDLVKKSDLAKTTAHRWLREWYENDFLDMEVESQGERPRHQYKLNKQGMEFAKFRLEFHAVELGIEAIK